MKTWELRKEEAQALLMEDVGSYLNNEGQLEEVNAIKRGLIRSVRYVYRNKCMHKKALSNSRHYWTRKEL